MARIKYAARLLSDWVARALPIIVWRIVEKLSLRAQGKGWGTDTLNDEVNTIRQLVNRIDLKKIVCADVGANVGLWALRFNKEFPQAKIICFEPNQEAFNRLAELTSERDEFICIKAAVSAEPGEAFIYFDAPTSGHASLKKRKLDHFGIEMKFQEKVNVTSLDFWVAENKLSPNIIKLDIEGYELAALQGASRTLESVRIIQFEFGGANIDTRTYFQDFWYFLSDLGFQLYRLGPKGITRIDKYRETDETFVTTNFFAVR